MYELCEESQTGYQKHEAFFRSFGADVPQLASKILSFLEDYESQNLTKRVIYIATRF